MKFSFVTLGWSQVDEADAGPWAQVTAGDICAD